MKLTTYFRSTAAYRVRIALNFKQIEHELVPVNLLTAEHKQAEFQQFNPAGLIPTLSVGQEVLTQSLVILEYLEEAHPQPPLLPSESLARAQVRALAHNIACDIHPLNNLRVLKYLVSDLAVDEERKLRWYHHWLKQGFDGIEENLKRFGSNGEFCYGNKPTLADVCLIPQVYNANRFEFALDDYPLIQSINQHCLSLPAFDQSQPHLQEDAIS